MITKNQKKKTKTIHLTNFKQVSYPFSWAALSQIEVYGKYIKKEWKTLEVRNAANSKDVKHYTTERLREEFHISNLFTKDNVRMVYSQIDRIITGGIMPVLKELKLEAGKELAADYFLQRREMGCINIGGKGIITIDGTEYEMNPRDGIYIGMGNKEIKFKTKLIGKHNVINLTVALGIANHLDIPFEKLVHSVRELKSVEHRLQLIPHGDFTIIDDSYNSNPISSKSALDTLAEFEGTKIIVTPGLIELGNDEEKYNFEFGKYMSGICDYIFLVNSNSAKSIMEGNNSTNFNKDKIFTVNTPQEAIAQISNLKINGKITALLENDLPDNY